MNHSKITYTGDGNTSQFHFDFAVWRAADVKVSRNGLPVPAAEYKLTLNKLPANASFGHDGGNIAFKVPPKIGDAITLFRELAHQRVVSYQPMKPVDPAALNADANYIMEVVRDMNRRVEGFAALENLAEIVERGTAIVEDMENALAKTVIDLSEYAKLSNIPEVPQLPDIDFAALAALVAQMAGADYVVESANGLSGPGYTSGWYRKYKSGWVEQGALGTNVSSESGQAIVLPVPMRNTDYHHLLSPGTTTLLTNTLSLRVRSGTKTPTGFTVVGTWSQGSSAGFGTWGIAWEVKGFAA
ncbi:MAG: hypothetical protein FWE64_02380 [Alphaproteobacteria bacterium]|nr:hypothetical protein [Alphaproteobacteria bacterium]